MALDWPSNDYSSCSSTTSPESVKAIVDHQQTNAHWNYTAVPYLDLRTKKRHRDGRPDQNIVHQNTLAKLFNAQRQIHMEEQRTYSRMSSPPISPLTQRFPESEFDTSSWQIPEIQAREPERNQRSINSFFGGSSAANVQGRRSQPAYFGINNVQNQASSVLRCEDCYTDLRSTNTDSMLDVDSMNIDTDLQQDEWACASCTRRVCDTCAVRGDYRICLECAVPGGG